MSKVVRDAMTPNPRTVNLHDSVVAAARIMEEEDVGSVPVVDADNLLAGMITDRDIALRVVAAGRDPRSTTTGEIATKQVSPAYRTSRSARRSSRWPIGRCAGCR